MYNIVYYIYTLHCVYIYIHTPSASTPEKWVARCSETKITFSSDMEAEGSIYIYIYYRFHDLAIYRRISILHDVTMKWCG